ncbi:histone H1-like repetitive region-containing protein, partial [Streptomyces sp. NPDC001848]|uniref:GlgB N-terminal domain-containing protein n=1 Tax=Streptomyces sp. NPDC001848 TaxID=3364618 RepID=UPI0036A581D8
MTPRPPSDDSTKNSAEGPRPTTGAQQAAAAASEPPTAGKKKAVAKKAATAAKKATAKTAASKKAVAKKAVAKKTAAKKTAAKATAAKATAPEVVAEKTAAETAAKKAPAKKAPAPAKKTAAKKTAAKKAVAKKAAAKEAPAKKAAVADPSAVAVSPTLAAADRERLLAGTHHDPHSVLGAHAVPGGVAFRAFRPYALSVTVVAGDERVELHDDGGGFFSGLLPVPDVPEYRLLVAYEGTVQDTEDAYRFLPTLGDLDLHLIGEGRHEELWKALGAHPLTHQGVAGTRFSVWAPNARGVRVAGSFNFWDGTGFPMRSLGSSGVWELFVPGIGEGELYKFEITRPDGSQTLRADPLARRTEAPPNTSSIVHASHHAWGDGEWMARRAERPVHEAPFSVYEVHLPSWRPGLTYRQLAEQLP